MKRTIYITLGLLIVSSRPGLTAGPPIEHDVAVYSIDIPDSSVVPAYVYFRPTATIVNQGQHPESLITVRTWIFDSLENVIYQDSLRLLTGDSLMPESTITDSFSTPFIPQPRSSYRLQVACFLDGDQNPGNDTLTLDFATYAHQARLYGRIVDDNQGGWPPGHNRG